MKYNIDWLLNKVENKEGKMGLSNLIPELEKIFRETFGKGK